MAIRLGDFIFGWGDVVDEPTADRLTDDRPYDEEAVEDRRSRTPFMRPLFPDDGGYDLDLGADL